MGGAIGWLGGVVGYVLLVYYNGKDDDVYFFFAGLANSLVFIMGGTSFIYDTGFLNDITDPVVGGMFITFIGSFMNLSSFLPETLGTYVIKHMDYDVYNILFLS